MVSIICLVEKDIKKLIAFSSVSHIRFIVAALLTKSEIGIIGSKLFLLSHGVSSAGIFYAAYFIYTISNSRSIMINKAFLAITPEFCGVLALFSFINISAPPTPNFFREIFCIIPVFQTSPVSFFPLRLIIFFRVAYSILLYSLSQYSQAPQRPFKQNTLSSQKDLVYFLALVYYSIIIFPTIL